MDPVEKLNGIAHEYAWLDKHPDDYVVVRSSILNGNKYRWL